MTAAATAYTALPLDSSVYDLNEEEISFFKTETGIQDDAELKRHIIEVQVEAYTTDIPSSTLNSLLPSLKIARHPAYKSVLKLGKERSAAILLDLGCCFGSDTRKVIADGFPRENIVASDICPEFWTLGHKLFKTTQETYTVKFIQGDIFDPLFLSPDASRISSVTVSSPSASPPSLATLKSLNPLRHHISVIHTSSFFHLFDEPQQHALAHLLGVLLSPLPGSMILGSHRGVPYTEKNGASGSHITEPRGTVLFCHSPRSWQKIWVGEDGVFMPEDVAISTTVREVERKDIVIAGGDPAYKAYQLVWSVTRI